MPLKGGERDLFSEALMWKVATTTKMERYPAKISIFYLFCELSAWHAKSHFIH